MQLRCVRPFGRHDVGDLAEAPDGAAYDPDHWEAVTAGADEVLDAMKAKAAELDDPPQTPPAAPGLPSASLFGRQQEGM